MTRPWLPSGRPNRRAVIALASLAVVIGGTLVEMPSAAAQYTDASAVSVEYKLKSVFLYKFATYVRWPPEAFAGVTSPFVIGILGPAPVGPGLRKIAAAKKIDGRKIEVRNFRQHLGNLSQSYGICRL